MAQLKFAKPERILLKNHPEYNERWVQDRIAEDPSILGLGQLIVKDKERMQSQAGRLDLLLQDPDTDHRYEVEIQLGQTDASHIIRTLEYWDIEHKRYPQYDHTAVIVAENITARFLNVISLFNGFIPLCAIQMHAVKLEDHISLIFTTVLGERQLGLVDEDEAVREVTDRAYWEKRSAKPTLAMVDEILDLMHTWDPELALTYTKHYIGLSRHGQPNNFVVFKPQKESVRIEPRLERSEEIQTQLDEAGIELLGYSSRHGRYRIRLARDDVKQHSELIKDILKSAYGNSDE